MKKTGWLVLNEDTLEAMEFIIDEEEHQESPYSNDGGILQFHLEIEFTEPYPTARVIE